MQHLNLLETSVKMMPKQAGSLFALTQSVNETEEREFGHEMNNSLGVETERWKRKGRSPRHARTVHFVFHFETKPNHSLE